MKVLYNKVNDINVLEAFCNLEVIGMGPCYVTKQLVAQYLNTSMYQVNKYCKILIEQGYLKTYKAEPFHDYDYESGIDFGNSLQTWITEITNKGIDKIKELGLYRKKWYEEEFE